MAASSETPESEPDIQLTRENAVAFQEWLGSLAARALFDHGAVTFFVDSDGDVRMEIPKERHVVRGNSDS